MELESIKTKAKFITIDTTKKEELNTLFDNAMKIKLNRQKDLEIPEKIPVIPSETLLYRDKLRTKQILEESKVSKPNCEEKNQEIIYQNNVSHEN